MKIFGNTPSPQYSGSSQLSGNNNSVSDSSSLPNDPTQVNVIDPKKNPGEDSAVTPVQGTLIKDLHNQTEGITADHPDDPNTVTFGNKPLSSPKSEDIPKINILSFGDSDTDLEELSFRQNAGVAVDCMADAAYCLDIGMPNVARYLADQANEIIQDLKPVDREQVAHEAIHDLKQQAK